jgi:membrane protease YdiL (CAAX protease family)
MKSKVLSLVEVSVVYALMLILFRYVRSIPLAVEMTTSLNGFLFPAYTALLIASLSLYLHRGQNQIKIPFPEKWKYQLVIVGRGFFPVFILSVLLGWINWAEWTGAILISIIEVGLIFWFAFLVKDKFPSWNKIGILGGFMLYPMAAQFLNKFGSTVISVIYFYLLVGLSEEILFRGYIQSRLNAGFGRPKQFFGIPWGGGLVITSGFFGLWHLTMNPEPSAWPHVLWTIAAGLLFGFVREKSESIIAPAILHGIMNYGPQAILFYLFWNN